MVQQIHFHSRNKDYGYFCRKAMEMYKAESSRVIIVSDCRRKTDIKFFEETFGTDCTKRVRVKASEDTRKQRGYIFQDGVDNAESECGLDDLEGGFDFVLNNDGDDSEKDILDPIFKWIDTV